MFRKAIKRVAYLCIATGAVLACASVTSPSSEPSAAPDPTLASSTQEPPQMRYATWASIFPGSSL